LLGSLVGLTSLTLAILLSIYRRSIGALVLIWLVGLCVLLQGVMGGLRVTVNSTHLAVVHGFFAHAILAGMVGVAVLLAPRHAARSTVGNDAARAPAEHDSIDGATRRDDSSDGAALPNETDGFLATLLVLAILGQTLLGTLVRQMDVGLMIHLSVAMLVAVLAILVGVRLWGLYPQISVFARGGVALIGVVVLQLILGGISLVCRTPPAAASPSAEQLQAQADALSPAIHAILTTAHQTVAAVLLGIATMLAFWAWRLAFMPGSVAAPEPSAINTETCQT
jgi:cytochrome c oxidase assembly protein subunit 15